VANEIATAARTTLASATARVWHRSFLDPPEPPLGRFVTTQEGVTDMARRRTRTELEGPPKIDEWGARLLARYPWLDDDEEDDEHERSHPTLVYAGTASFFKSGGRWMVDDEGAETGRTRGPMDPLWIVDVLAHADEAVPRGEDVVRGVSCRRWEFRVDPAVHGERCEGTDGSERRPLRLAGDAWIDHDGRLRRVTWTRLHRGRSRWPWKPPSGPRAWQTTELWDFGLPVEIEVPTVEPERSPPWLLALMDLAWRLWRRRRAYERRRPGA
jgi:hypothetical protein